MEELFDEHQLQKIQLLYDDKNNTQLYILIVRIVNIRPPIILNIFIKEFDYNRSFDEFMEELYTINKIFNRNNVQSSTL